jgi:hypothetical protein
MVCPGYFFGDQISNRVLDDLQLLHFYKYCTVSGQKSYRYNLGCVLYYECCSVQDLFQILLLPSWAVNCELCPSFSSACLLAVLVAL